MPRARRSSSKDQFVNRAYVNVTESAAGTLTFQQLTTGTTLFEKVAWILHRVNFWVGNADLVKLLNEGDLIQAAIVTNNSLSSIGKQDPNVISQMEWSTIFEGTPGTAWYVTEPYTLDYTTLPGGGLIMPAYPVYGAVIGTSLASAVAVAIEMFYTAMQLSAQEYWELVEATRVVT